MPHFVRKGSNGGGRGSHGGGRGHGGGDNTKNGRVLPHNVKSAADFDDYRVTQDDWEGIRNALYDTVVYPAAGTNQLTCFAIKQGDGTTWSGGGSKTFSDTNMQLGGQLPADQRFLMESIEVGFWPCQPTVANFFPADFGTAVTATWINDQWVFRQSGNLELKIASKSYLNEAPMAVFPSKTVFEITGALSDSSTPITHAWSAALYANQKGRPYIMHPYAIGLDWGEAFQVQLNWPEGKQAMPSNNPAIVRLRLDGILQRRAQ